MRVGTACGEGAIYDVESECSQECAILLACRTGAVSYASRPLWNCEAMAIVYKIPTYVKVGGFDGPPPACYNRERRT